MAGVKVYGVLVRDRETSKAYVMHDTCLDVLRETPGVSRGRFVEMGPGSSDPTEQCALAACAGPLGAE